MSFLENLLILNRKKCGLQSDPRLRIAQPRGDLKQRFQDEPAVKQSGMRDGQLGRRDDLSAVQQYVDINDPRSFCDRIMCPVAAKTPFNAVSYSEKGVRIVQGSGLHDYIQEPRLICELPRLRFVNRGLSDDIDSVLFQPGKRHFEVARSVAEIRAKGQVDLLHRNAP